MNPEDYPEPSAGGLAYLPSGSTWSVEKAWEPVRWTELYTSLVEMHVAGIPIAKMPRILKRFGGKRLSPRQISRVLNSHKGQELASLMSIKLHQGLDALQTKLGDFAPEAIGVELDIMRNPFSAERHRVAAAQDILDRGGLPKVSRQEVQNQLPTTVILNILPSQLSALLAPPPIIEAEIIELDRLPSSTANVE
jgi:hypothetical protein